MKQSAVATVAILLVSALISLPALSARADDPPAPPPFVPAPAPAPAPRPERPPLPEHLVARVGPRDVTRAEFRLHLAKASFVAGTAPKNVTAESTASMRTSEPGRPSHRPSSTSSIGWIAWQRCGRSARLIATFM